jgi:hypothetical protein
MESCCYFLGNIVDPNCQYFFEKAFTFRNPMALFLTNLMSRLRLQRELFKDLIYRELDSL